MKLKNLFGLTILLICNSQYADAQDWPKHEVIDGSGLSWQGFVDTYLAHGFNEAETDTRAYTTQASREDRFRLNLAFLSAKLDQPDWYSGLTLQLGDSVTANYASEKYEFWQYVQEAYAGYNLNDKLSITAGIYLAHIGMESFNSRDNWNYTRSLVAEYSPYYETGIKLSYKFDEQWSGQFHLLRGWQNISSDSDPAIGMQLAWTPSDKWQITYNNFVGDVEGTRIFNEMLFRLNLTEKLSLAGQFDLGAQERADNDEAYWHGWSIISQYKLSDKIALAGRVERYSDPHQVVLQSASEKSFNATGLSTNIDIQILPMLFWRNEYKVYLATSDVFPRNSEEFSSNDHLIVSSLSYSF